MRVEPKRQAEYRQGLGLGGAPDDGPLPLELHGFARAQG